MVRQLSENLDAGEAVSIVLALELPTDFLLMDEKKGRTVAKSLGLPVTGLLGVLIRAKNEGVVAEIRPILEDLISTTGFRIHQNLYLEALRLAGE